MKRLVAIILAISSIMSFPSFAYEKSSYEVYEKACKEEGRIIRCDMYTSTDVNMRTGPGTKYPVYKVLPEGTEILLNNDEDPSGWYEVWYDNNVYFIYGDYIKIVVR